MKNFVVIFFSVLMLVSCAGGGSADKARQWTEQDVSRYVVYWQSLPKTEAQAKVSEFFDGIEAQQASDTSSLTYLQVTEWVSKYLYDPNSPVRDEDIYLPFVRKMAASRFTSEDRRPGYQYQAEMCALNRYGTVAADFSYRDIHGVDHRMSDIKADCLIMLFSNPGCHSCKEIVDAICGFEGIDEKMASGRVAVLNIYIDEDIEAWKAYQDEYPDNWINGYDPEYIIREDVIYNVRAIPSIYVLDSGKRVLMKDVPLEKLLLFLNNI